MHDSCRYYSDGVVYEYGAHLILDPSPPAYGFISFLEDTVGSFDTVVANQGLHHDDPSSLWAEIDLLMSLFPGSSKKDKLIYRTTFPK